MSGQYFGAFSEYEDIWREFGKGAWDYDKREYALMDLPNDFPTEDEVLIAGYDTPSYEGYAYVLFEKNGELFEVYASHCSCNGLDGQWNPARVTWAALAMRGKHLYEHPWNGAVAQLASERNR